MNSYTFLRFQKLKFKISYFEFQIKRKIFLIFLYPSLIIEPIDFCQLKSLN